MKKTTKGNQATKKKSPEIKVIPELKEDKPGDIEGRFFIKSLVWKDGQAAWALTLEIRTTLDQSFINYNARIAFNPEPYLDRIKAVRDEISDIQADSTLFPKIQAERVKERENEIDSIKEEMVETKERCQTIEFPATAIKMDMTGTYPKITFIIPSSVVEKINQMKLEYALYKIMLDKISVE